MIKNMFYFYNINKIGGVENFFYELAKKYNKFDIVVYYTSGDPDQIKRLRKYITVKKYNEGDIIECEKAFFNYKANIIENVIAQEYYMIIHADYKQQRVVPNTHPKITKYIGVSQAVCDSFTELTGLPCELCYNPITLDPPKRTLHLVSATRLTKEKGKWRMKKLAKTLNDANIPFVWDIYTNDVNEIKEPNVRYQKPTLEINGKLSDADYVVQLSDSESYCYTMVQALMLKVPVIVCPWECLKELKVNNDYGFILPFDMNNIPVEDIYNKHFDFEYIPPEDRWNEILAPGKSKLLEARKYMYKVRARKTYQDLKIADIELGRIPNRGETWYITKDRLDFLSGENDRKLVMVDVIEKIKMKDYQKLKDLENNI